MLNKYKMIRHTLNGAHLLFYLHQLYILIIAFVHMYI